MSARYPDVVPCIRSWLSENHERIMSFWIGAQWEKWARYELFMALEKSFSNDCVVMHGVDIWEKDEGEVDILVEPHDESMSAIAIKLRCEKVSENEGSYERFRDQMDSDMDKVKGLGDVENSFEGAKLLLIGFSGEPSAEESEFRTEPQPEHFVAGEVHCWAMVHNLSTGI
ncbi:hypothetical protein JX265_007677 [Neoarthrinium moseri]|uniref:Uncharacterized protein n=1 Tax=Neoarthrinium moseri TaxID=1658444 RepID=A0A9P9WJX9_9PEZI|nr:uncharacterized protein JN550_012953 [Neoarthrinium moseri]KAI1854452.1 hypothetical protein JX266_000570 [Neoarthrinium moseri]KAI1857878.1 hypothetical protein JN550_012953 [Neoarthrinium moseri]KAI1867101.1 hypothetical protein JX265_007677 [Neoarthrinium moseri]